MRDSFVLYSNYYDILQSTSLEDLGAIFKAILTYAKEDTVIELPPHLKLAFGFIKNQMDIDEDKYNKKVERLKINGKKGGEAKALANAKKEETNVANPAIAKIAKHNVNDNVNENENENENVNENVNVLSLNVEKENEKEREILENYVRKHKLATKNVKAYVRKIIENGDSKRILEEMKPPKRKEERIQEELSSIHDKKSAARVLFKYYSVAEFPPDEFMEIMEKYDLDTYDKMYEYVESLNKTKEKSA